MSDAPIAGHYLTRLVRGGPMVPVWLWADSRAPCGFRALAGGEPIDVFKVWPYCGREPIAEDEYRYRLALLVNGERAGEISRDKPIDHLKTRTIF